MNIEFGSIETYYPDRGFGFISCNFSNPNKKVFFHIKKIKRKYLDLSQKLDNGEDIKTVNFWYEIETTPKGEQVSKIWLNANNIPERYTDELCILKHRLEGIWSDLKFPIASWLDLVTEELVGVKRKDELSVQRDRLESQLKTIEEERRKKEEKQKQDENKRIRNYYGLTEKEADELRKLVERMLPLNFTRSKELSKYIVDNQLGYEYPNISGIVTMKDRGEQWDFNGGFPPKIYKIICEELDLKSQGTRAIAVAFRPYISIY